MHADCVPSATPALHGGACGVADVWLAVLLQVKPSDMLAEMQGRLPIRVELKGLT